MGQVRVRVNGIDIDATDGLTIEADTPPEGSEIGPVRIVFRGGLLRVRPAPGPDGSSVTITGEGEPYLALGEVWHE